jgi:Ni,Fe-hydrogenase maturation factor
VHQLTPELSERLTAVKAAIFVDASAHELPEVTVTSLNPIDSGFTLAHGCDPRSLLTLAQTLYGKSPQAWSVEIPVSDIRIGENLSAIAQAGMATALDQIQALIQEILPKHPSPS